MSKCDQSVGRETAYCSLRSSSTTLCDLSFRITNDAREDEMEENLQGLGRSGGSVHSPNLSLPSPSTLKVP